MITEQEAEEMLISIRFVDGLECVFCGSKYNIWKLATGQWKCSSCRKPFRILTGTPIEKTRIEPKDWIQIIYLFTKNIPPAQIRDSLGLTLKTVYQCYRMIRVALVKQISPQFTEEYLQRKEVVLGIFEDQNGVQVFPLAFDEKRTISFRKGKMLPDRYSGFIMPHNIITSYAPDEENFFNYYNQITKNTSFFKRDGYFSISVHGLAFLYNYRNIDDEVLVKKILTYLLSS